MKKVLKKVSFVILLLQLCIVFGQESAIQKRIVIDVGHGGKNSGAIGVNGIMEKEVVLKIGSEISVLNKMIFKGRYDIYLTRDDDRFIQLSDRSRLAKSLKADLFVSLHCNASANNSRGIEVYTLNYFSKDSELNIKESIALGMEVLDEANLKLKIENRGMKFANFQVLREIIPHCPTLLLETGFLTNEDEGNYFLIPEKIRGMALAIFKGIDNYLKSRL
ncbi:MAG TPA: N-acetylmuramoyl-L-alanine amidase [Leeuwenhoekiella sp.]|nr:N-acetylmuramoyl-L-alanine amidase [Leeuwenhoekiella sp.]